jgi:hypothetical protein
LRDVVDRLEPDAQRLLAGSEYRCGIDRRLLAAGIALEQAARASIHETLAAPTAVWTFKTVGLTQLHERRMAFLLAALHFVKTSVAEPF